MLRLRNHKTKTVTVTRNLVLELKYDTVNKKPKKLITTCPVRQATEIFTCPTRAVGQSLLSYPALHLTWHSLTPSTSYLVFPYTLHFLPGIPLHPPLLTWHSLTLSVLPGIPLHPHVLHGIQLHPPHLTWYSFPLGNVLPGLKSCTHWEQQWT